MMAGVAERIALVAAASLTAAASAQNIFTIDATGGSPPVTVGSDHLIDLVDQAVNTQGQFAGFQNADANFSLNYGGVPNAIVISKNASNTQASVTFGPTGVTRTFNGTSQADLEKQIEDYLKKNGASDLRDFYKAINKLSRIAVSDGNPNATTARMAEFTYNRFGFFGDETKAYTISDEGTVDDAGTQFHLGLSGKTYDSGDFSGETATVTTSITWNFTRHVGLSLGAFLSYATVEDADVFNLGFAAGIPVRIVIPDGKTGVLWQVTPFFSTAGSGSVDMGTGGLITGFGGTNILAWTPAEKFTFAMANQIGFYDGKKLSFDDYEIDPGVSQTVLKNGLRATFRFDDHWGVYGGASYTNFLKDAAIENWVTPEIGVTFASTAGSGFLLGFTGDFGDNYSAYGARLLLKLAF